MNRIATHAARILLGLVFFVFGLNGFLNFIPMPPQIPAGAAALMGAFSATGYLMALIKGTEVLVGVLLLTNRFVPLALALLAPVLVNILAFHFFLEPATTLVMPVVLLVSALFLAWQHRNRYVPMLQARNPLAESEQASTALRPANA